MAGNQIAALGCVAELVKSFDYLSFPKVLTTFATKLNNRESLKKRQPNQLNSDAVGERCRRRIVDHQPIAIQFEP